MKQIIVYWKGLTVFCFQFQNIDMNYLYSNICQPSRIKQSFIFNFTLKHLI